MPLFNNIKNCGEPLDNITVNETRGRTLMFADLFFKHMLFERESTDDIRLLILGCGENGKSAFRLAFAAGQTLGRALHMAVVSQEGISEFRDSMPLLKEHARVIEYKGFQEWRADLPASCLADVIFERNTVDKTNIGDIVKRYSPTYVLVCFGGDHRNKTAAEFISLMFPKIFIGYVQKRTYPDTLKTNRCVPCGRVADTNELNSELLRMTKNVFSQARPSLPFNKPDDLLDSVETALHIKYMVESIGIKTDDPIDASEKFSRLLRPTALKTENIINRDKLDELILTVHRRALARLIAYGFTPPKSDDELIEYLGGETRFHPAAVRSRISKGIPKNFDWNGGSLSGLDELDRASINVHRALGRLIESKSGETDAFVRDRLEKLKTILCEGDETRRIYEEIMSETNRVLNGCAPSAVYFKTTVDRVIVRSYSVLPREKAERCERLILDISARLSEHLAYLTSFSFKSNDAELIKNIPCILKYTSQTVLFQSFYPLAEMNADAVVNVLRLRPRGAVFFGVIDGDSPLSPNGLENRLCLYLASFSEILLFLENRAGAVSCDLFLTARCVAEERRVELLALCHKLCDESDISLERVRVVFGNVTDTVGEALFRYGDIRIVNGFFEGSPEHDFLRGDRGAVLFEEYKDCLRPSGLSVEERLELRGAVADEFERPDMYSCENVPPCQDVFTSSLIFEALKKSGKCCDVVSNLKCGGYLIDAAASAGDRLFLVFAINDPSRLNMIRKCCARYGAIPIVVETDFGSLRRTLGLRIIKKRSCMEKDKVSAEKLSKALKDIIESEDHRV